MKQLVDFYYEQLKAIVDELSSSRQLFSGRYSRDTIIEIIELNCDVPRKTIDTYLDTIMIDIANNYGMKG